jgi:hypothetical protein
MAKLMTVQDWIPEHPYPNIFFLTAFIPGINGLSKVVCQRERERKRERQRERERERETKGERARASMWGF